MPLHSLCVCLWPTGREGETKGRKERNQVSHPIANSSVPPRRLQRALPETGRRSTPSGCATSPCSAGAGYSRSRRPHQPWPQSHRQPGGKYTHAHTAGERVREKNKPKSQSPPSTSRSLAYLPRVLLEPVELVYPRGRPLLLLLDLTDLGVAHEAGDVRNGTP